MYVTVCFLNALRTLSVLNIEGVAQRKQVFRVAAGTRDQTVGFHGQLIPTIGNPHKFVELVRKTGKEEVKLRYRIWSYN